MGGFFCGNAVRRALRGRAFTVKSAKKVHKNFSVPIDGGQVQGYNKNRK